MNLSQLRQRGPFEWELPARGSMRVPGVIYADAALIADMDEKVREQVSNVAALPGIDTADDLRRAEAHLAGAAAPSTG